MSLLLALLPVVIFGWIAGIENRATVARAAAAAILEEVQSGTRDLSDRLVQDQTPLGDDVPEFTLPAQAFALTLFQPGQAPRALFGDVLAAPTTPAPRISSIVADADGSILRLTLPAARGEFLIGLDRDFSVPLLRSRILEAAVLPLVLLALTLAIASIVIRFVATREIRDLGDDMRRFRADRSLPQAEPAAPRSDDISAIRTEFLHLAGEIRNEQSIAEARLFHAEQLQKEVFHRVSNNFQVIQSITRLVARDKTIADPLREIEERVLLLSIAHQAQHQINSAELRPISRALPEVIRGMRTAGYLRGVEVEEQVLVSHLPIDRSYALIYLMIEGLRRIDRAGASVLTITLGEDSLTIEGDFGDVPPDKTSDGLTTAAARELGGKVLWAAGRFSAQYARR